MPGYLGEFPVDLATLPYGDYTKADWALHWLAERGQYDGAHSKARCLDGIARILNGTPVTVTEARWDDGQTELRFTLGEASSEYLAWVETMKGEYDAENDEHEYEYDDGTN